MNKLNNCFCHTTHISNDNISDSVNASSSPVVILDDGITCNDKQNKNNTDEPGFGLTGTPNKTEQKLSRNFGSGMSVPRSHNATHGTAGSCVGVGNPNNVDPNFVSRGGVGAGSNDGHNMSWMSRSPGNDFGMNMNMNMGMGMAGGTGQEIMLQMMLQMQQQQQQNQQQFIQRMMHQQQMFQRQMMQEMQQYKKEQQILYESIMPLAEHKQEDNLNDNNDETTSNFQPVRIGDLHKLAQVMLILKQTKQTDGRVHKTMEMQLMRSFGVDIDLWRDPAKLKRHGKMILKYSYDSDVKYRLSDIDLTIPEFQARYQSDPSRFPKLNKDLVNMEKDGYNYGNWGNPRHVPDDLIQKLFPFTWQ